jgi:hypothetical protein
MRMVFPALLLVAADIDAFDAKLLTQNDVTVRLPRGSFTIESGQLPCDGNCSVLDAETDRCRRELQVDGSEDVRAVVRVRPGEGCTIALEG